MKKNKEKPLQKSIDEMADDEVLKLSLEEPSHFGKLISRYQEAFTRAALSITHSREETEDILQETFTKIYLNGHRFKKEPGATFKSWAYKILINTSFTHYQKLRKTTGHVSYLDPILYDEDDIEEVEEDKATVMDNKALVRATIEKMPEHLGRLLKLYYIEDKSYKDIATVEAISTTTLKMRLFRAKRLFKKIIKEGDHPKPEL